MFDCRAGLSRLVKKLAAFEGDAAVVAVRVWVADAEDDRLNTDWKCVSHVGAWPNVAIEEIWMTIFGGELSSILRTGIVDRIS